MTARHLACGLLLSTVLALPAAAQTSPPASAPAAPKADAQTQQMQKHAGQWRSSKMIGLGVYNQQNERLGDINEILIDASGKVVGYVLGVGGFLGMGEHDVMVTPDKLKFVNEPVRTAATNTAPEQRAAEQRATEERGRQTTGTAATRPDRTARDPGERWWPDHAVFNATKDQLKAMPQFKYSNYN